MTDGELKAAILEHAYLEGEFVLRSGGHLFAGITHEQLLAASARESRTS